MSGAPALWLVAGPDGVGKAARGRRYLTQLAGTDAFVNLDEIGRGLSPLRATPAAIAGPALAKSPPLRWR